jgi:hypothetical protein
VPPTHWINEKLDLWRIPPDGGYVNTSSMDEGTSSWFMVSWPEGGKPQVVMEFWTREEAEMALELAMRVGVDSRPAADRVSTGLYPAPVLMSDPFMKEALLAWDDQLQELDSIERQIRRGG